jgi:hypothetical protein
MKQSLFSRPLIQIMLAVLFLTALAVRLYDISDEPLEVHPTRQMRSALVARALYYPTAPDVTPEQAAAAKDQAAALGVIEPPILERLTVLLYRLAGGEMSWLGRLVSIGFWLAGGWAVYALSARLGSPLTGLVSLSVYLFLPFGLRFSRTLLPDPMMVASSVLALWVLVRWQETRQTGWAAAAGALTGFAILSKSVAGIILIVPFAAYLLAAIGIRSAIRNWQVWLIFLLAALPSAAYYYWGLVLDGRLATQFSGRFFPDLWTDLLLYKSWGKRILIEFGLPWLAAGLIGIALGSEKAHRWLLLGWWAGYFGYGMLFSYHIMTHDYYHLPLVPLMAVSIAPALAWVEARATGKWRTITAIGMAALAVGTVVFGADRQVQFVGEEDYRQTRQAYEALAAALEDLPDGRIIALTEDYETTFKFYTFRSAAHWPHLGDLNYYALQGSDPQDPGRLWARTEGFDYFLVADERELVRQPDLAAQLASLPVVFESGGLRLFALGDPGQ